MKEKTLEALSKACLAYYVEEFPASTPTIGPFVRVRGQGTHDLMFYLYADESMTKSIGAIDVRLHSWSPTARSTTNT
jgi:hypothetical protein